MKLNLYQISCSLNRTPNLESTNLDLIFTKMNEFYLQTAEKMAFLKEINSYISILFFVYFDSQTKSNVSKSKQTANYVKKYQDL